MLHRWFVLLSRTSPQEGPKNLPNPFPNNIIFTLNGNEQTMTSFKDPSGVSIAQRLVMTTSFHMINFSIRSKSVVPPCYVKSHIDFSTKLIGIFNLYCAMGSLDIIDATISDVVDVIAFFSQRPNLSKQRYTYMSCPYLPGHHQ